MDREKIEAGFKFRLAQVLKDLNENGVKDEEAMWLIGSLAGEMINNAKVKDWLELKASISQSGFDLMLNELQNQGQKMHETGNVKAAYAVQTISTSLVANTMKDKDTIKGRKLLDSLIDHAVNFYNSKKNKKT